MANLIESMGYSLGKIHTGLIAYMCDLYRDGESRPLELFLKGIELPDSFKPVPKREYPLGNRNRADLVILNAQNNLPFLIIEMKVDDHESMHQTQRIADAAPAVEHFFFITLGHGEYYHPPYDKRFRWIRLSEFNDLIRQISAECPAIGPFNDWSQALQNEMNQRDDVRGNIRDHIGTFRAGSWNICFLGQLKESLWEELDVDFIEDNTTCYTHGNRPDTMLNFGWTRSPYYAEINNNGRLNCKVSFNGCQTPEERQMVYNAARQFLEHNLGVHNFRSYRVRDKTMTMVSLDIGLNVENGYLKYQADAQDTIHQLATLLRQFFVQESGRLA